MKVELIDYTGWNNIDPADFAGSKLIAAKKTRLDKNVNIDTLILGMTNEEFDAELAYIANTIRSSWEFINYTFRISGISRACCDQIVRTRTASFAVKTQRIGDHSEFDYVIPETIAANPELKRDFINHMVGVQGFYADLVAAGIPSQDARSVLPMATESPLTAQYNLRTLADVVGKRENLRAQGEYVEVAKEMKRLVLEVHGWAKFFLDPDRTATPRLDAMLKDALGSAGPGDKPEVYDALKELDKLKGVWG